MENPDEENHDGDKVDAAAGEGKLKEVLEHAVEDLDNAELPSLVNWAFAPFRKLILSPVVHTAAMITPTIPVIDDVSDFFVDTAFKGVKFVYGILP
jgi:hypothetical protein